MSRKCGPQTGPPPPRKPCKEAKLRASARLDRTQEVAGSSPASSTRRTQLGCGLSRFRRRRPGCSPAILWAGLRATHRLRSMRSPVSSRFSRMIGSVHGTKSSARLPRAGPPFSPEGDAPEKVRRSLLIVHAAVTWHRVRVLRSREGGTHFSWRPAVACASRSSRSRCSGSAAMTRSRPMRTGHRSAPGHRSPGRP
jgi:hypothetical protein